MKRIELAPRDNWRNRVESQGLTFHSVDGEPYWAEGVAYEFTSAEVDTIEAATNELNDRCMDAVDLVIRENRYEDLGISPSVASLIERSWNEDAPSIYGRMDLAFGPDGVPKLLEYNADTPTSLLEAAVIQWSWFEDVVHGYDQFNSIHDRLIAKWRELREQMDEPVFFSHMDTTEDQITAAYIADTAQQAGLETRGIRLSDIGWNGRNFLDMAHRPIANLFKLYPWEWILSDEYGRHVQNSGCTFIEPAWKILLSSKGILPILWEMFPEHENLLPACQTHDGWEGMDGCNYVCKPMFSREGANVSIIRDGQPVETVGGPYDGPTIYQDVADLGNHDGWHPVIGSWLIDHQSSGMGIRESKSLITSNTARFVPHYFKD